MSAPAEAAWVLVDKDPDRYRRIEDHRADRVGGVDQSAVGVEPDQHQFGAAGAGVGEAFGHQPLLRGHDVAVDREGIDDRGLSLCSGCGGVRLAVRVLRGVAGGGVSVLRECRIARPRAIPGTTYFSPDAPATASIPVSSPSCPAGSLCNEERVAGKACEAAAGRMLPLSSSAVSKQNVAIGLIGFGFNQVL